MFREFKEFALRGNVMDMAVGIVLGGAFGKIVSSLVADMILPPLGLITGGGNFDERFINLGDASYPTIEAARAAGAPTMNYGTFIGTIIDFLLIAFAIFLVVRVMNAARREPAPEPPAAPETKDCPRCLSTIPAAATRCAHCTTDI